MTDFKRIHPLEFQKAFLNASLRSDGRSFLERRSFESQLGSISKANGSCTLNFGGTLILCGIKAEIAPPEPTQPCAGWIVPNIDLSPLCSSDFKPGPPSDTAQTHSELLHRILKGFVKYLHSSLQMSQSRKLMHRAWKSSLGVVSGYTMSRSPRKYLGCMYFGSGRSSQRL